MQETGSVSMFDLAGSSYNLLDFSLLDLEGARESLESIECVRYQDVEPITDYMSVSVTIPIRGVEDLIYVGAAIYTGFVEKGDEENTMVENKGF